MKLKDLIVKFSDTPEHQQKTIFNSLFIIGNKLQTLFDHRIPEISLKQFMLLSIVKNTKDPLTFTQLGSLLGCSRQNIKKLASVLEKKGFVEIRQKSDDVRASCICPTKKMNEYFVHEFPKYEGELNYLFEIYTEDEIASLFRLLTKLYAGIEHLEKKINQ